MYIKQIHEKLPKTNSSIYHAKLKENILICTKRQSVHINIHRIAIVFQLLHTCKIMIGTIKTRQDYRKMYTKT